jgi:hypothetical protein
MIKKEVMTLDYFVRHRYSVMIAIHKALDEELMVS